MSPRTARSPARASSSTWSTRCSPSRATAAHQFRILRAVKNRFGPTDEIGVFEMTGGGLARGREPVRAVPRPSAISAARARRSSPAWRARGRCWSRSRRWSRRPRSARRAAPWSAGTRTGCRWCSPCSRPTAACSLGGHDVYLNVAGGLRILEPAADLAVGRGAGLLAHRRAAAGRRRLFRRDRAVRRRPAGGAGGRAAARRPASSASPAPSCRHRAQRRRRDRLAGSTAVVDHRARSSRDIAARSPQRGRDESLDARQPPRRRMTTADLRSRYTRAADGAAWPPWPRAIGRLER